MTKNKLAAFFFGRRRRNKIVFVCVSLRLKEKSIKPQMDTDERDREKRDCQQSKADPQVTRSVLNSIAVFF